MEKLQIPDGYQAVMPYLILRDALGFLVFAKAVFGAKEKMLHLDEGQKLMHGELDINGSTLMVGEASEKWPANNAGLYVHVPHADTVYDMALSLGANSLMEPSDKDYGRSCGFRDPYGNVWWPVSSVKA